MLRDKSNVIGGGLPSLTFAMDAEQTQVNLLVVRALNALEIPYFLCGSMASSMHGIYRATADADFVADVRPHHAAPLATMLRPVFYAEEQAIRVAAQSKDSFNVIHLDTMLKVDIFTMKHGPFERSQLARRVVGQTASEPRASFYIASAEDTVLAKLDWYRQGGGVSDRQWNDVLGVLKVQGPALDLAYLKEWAHRLGLTELLKQALDDAGLA